MTLDGTSESSKTKKQKQLCNPALAFGVTVSMFCTSAHTHIHTQTHTQTHTHTHTHTQASKRIWVSAHPQILIVHLERFGYTASTGRR